MESGDILVCVESFQGNVDMQARIVLHHPRKNKSHSKTSPVLIAVFALFSDVTSANEVVDSYYTNQTEADYRQVMQIVIGCVDDCVELRNPPGCSGPFVSEGSKGEKVSLRWCRPVAFSVFLGHLTLIRTDRRMTMTAQHVFICFMLLHGKTERNLHSSKIRRLSLKMFVVSKAFRFQEF